MPVVALAAAAARSEHEPTAGDGGAGDGGGGLEAEWVASGSGDMTIKVWRLSQALLGQRSTERCASPR